MEKQRPKIDRNDVAGILLLAGLIRGGRAVPYLLQFAGLLCGAAAVLTLVSGRYPLGALLAAAAWAFWYAGYRLETAIAPKPLDLAAPPAAEGGRK